MQFSLWFSMGMKSKLFSFGFFSFLPNTTPQKDRAAYLPSANSRAHRRAYWPKGQ
jgi:hypothetical protein